jgi:glycosyltransferase involved in cell wall biosynthesis
MKIAIFSNSYPGYIGGGEKYTLSLAEALYDYGMDVFLIVPRKRISKRNIISKFYIIEISGPTISEYSLSIFKILKTMRAIKPDVIHLASSPSPTELILLPLLKISIRVPIFVSFHALFRSRFVNSLIKLSAFFYNLADGMTANSNFLDRLLRRWGVRSEKILEIRTSDIYAPPLKKFNTERAIESTRDKSTILFVGILDKSHKYKGLEILLLACQELKFRNTELYNSLNIKIIGSGNRLSYFKKLTKDFELPNVEYLGKVSSNDLIVEYKSADILVLPSSSYAEGYGTVVMESLFLGTPVIVSRFAGVSELVDEYRVGLVVESINSSKLATAIENYFLNTTLREMILKNSSDFYNIVLSRRERAVDAIVKAYYHSVLVRNNSTNNF